MTAINALDAFMTSVDTQRGKQLIDADDLVAVAREIIDLLVVL